MKHRQQKPLKRSVGGLRPRRTFVVFCEGKQTEPEYLEALRHQPAVRETASVDLRVEKQTKGSVPLVLVQMAVAARDRALREEAEIDEFWCVFDVEWPTNHPKLKEALELASQNEIKVAVSNPCFELWLILHFQPLASWLDNDHARRIRRELDGQPRKALNGNLYMPLRHDATARARELEKRHESNGNRFPNDNPSSGMHRLITAVELPFQ